MSETQPQEPSGIVMSETHESSPVAQRSSRGPMVFFALAGLAFAGSQVWANRTDWQAAFTGEVPAEARNMGSCCSKSAAEGGCCPSTLAAAASSDVPSCCQGSADPLAALAAAAEGGSCPLSGCSGNHDQLAQAALEQGSCCQQMKGALAAALLEVHSEQASEQELQISTLDDSSLPPAPPLPTTVE